MTIPASIHEFLDDRDTITIATLRCVAWREQLKDAMKEYNELNGTTHDPHRVVIEYERLRKRQNDEADRTT